MTPTFSYFPLDTTFLNRGNPLGLEIIYIDPLYSSMFFSRQKGTLKSCRLI